MNCIYIFRCGMAYKIGFSSDYLSRLKALQQANPVKIEMVRVYETRRKNASLFEKILHTLYKEKRIHGEWFKLSHEDIIHIDRFLHGRNFQKVEDAYEPEIMLVPRVEYAKLKKQLKYLELENDRMYSFIIKHFPEKPIMQ